MDFTGLLTVLYKQCIIRGMLEKGFKYKDNLDAYSCSKFISWSMSKFTWTELANSMESIFKSIDSYIKENFKDEYDIAHIQFNVKDCEALVDRDNPENMLFRTLVKFNLCNEYFEGDSVKSEYFDISPKVRTKDEIVERMNKIEANILDLIKSGLWNDQILREEKCWLDALGWTIRKGEFNK